MTPHRATSLSLLGTLGAGLCLAGLMGPAGCYADEKLNPAPLPTAPTGQPDAGAGGDGGTALRSLVARRLFGDMPLDNRFHDPGFTMLDGTGWMPIDYANEVINQVARAHLARTPTDQPALHLWAPPEAPVATVFGEAKGASGPMVVSIWLGRPDGQDPTVDSEAALFGLFLDGTPSAVDLALDSDPAPVTLDGRAWHRLSVQLTDGPVGFCYLSVSNRGDHPLYLTAPVLTAVDAQRDLISAHLGKRRPLRAAEASALRAATEHKRRQLGGPTDG